MQYPKKSSFMQAGYQAGNIFQVTISKNVVTIAT